MTTRAARTTWKGHELVTKAIFEALLKQSNAQNLEIKHNAKIPGLKVGHQIDVYWKFSMGGIDHFVIVEVKRKKAKASQGDLLKFSAVLSDIPGQPRGVFVSQNGYQRGAVNVARAQGIEVFEIKEVSQDARREHVTMTNLSIAMLTVKPDWPRWNLRSLLLLLAPSVFRWMCSGLNNIRKYRLMKFKKALSRV